MRTVAWILIGAVAAGIMVVDIAVAISAGQHRVCEDEEQEKAVRGIREMMGHDRVEK